MKSHPFFKHLEAGFGLTEAMLAAGLMGGIALMTAKLNTDMTKSAKGTEVKFEYQSLHSDIRAWLTNEDAAYATFNGSTGIDLTTCNGNSNAAAPATCQITAIKYPAGSTTTTKWAVGTYSSTGTSGKNSGYTTANLIEIDSAWLSSYVKNSAATTAGLPGTGEVILNLRYENLGYRTRASGVQYTVKQIPIRVTVNGSDLTTGAVAASGSGSSQWLDFADMSGIYYASGGVRIGATGAVFDGPSLIMGTGNTTTSTNSGALGNSNYVSGISSFAIGHGSVATTTTSSGGTGGPMSAIAIGRSNTASGSESTSIGYGNVATERFSMALGTASYALGYASMALGVWTISSGHNSLATGYYSESNGGWSNSFGSYTKANGEGSMTMGDNSTSTYLVNATDNSFASRFANGYSFFTNPNVSPTQGAFITKGGNLMAGGSNITVDTPSNTSATNSILSGVNNKVTGTSSAAIGSGNTVTSNIAISVGTGNVNSGWASGTIGQTNTVSGDKSVAIGWQNNIAGDNAFIVGAASVASGNYSMALGVRASAIDPGAMVLSGYPAASFNVTSNAMAYTAQYRYDNRGVTPYAWPYYGCNNTANCSVGGPDSYTARFKGGYRLFTNDPGSTQPTTGVFLGPSASSWGSISDKTKKEHFEEIDGEELLAKISGLPILKWKYIGSKDPHMGPMAQDFYKAFKLGDGNDRVITTQDIEGVTIAGVQALEKRTRELQKENDDLKQRIERLESLLLKK